ncbi:hypothetical protein ETH_00003385, partial [Eimeria tenella]
MCQHAISALQQQHEQVQEKPEHQQQQQQQQEQQQQQQQQQCDQQAFGSPIVHVLAFNESPLPEALAAAAEQQQLLLHPLQQPSVERSRQLLCSNKL